MSTMLVHEPTTAGRPIDEQSALDAHLPYRESKIRTEQLIREERGDIAAVFIRPAGVYDDGGHSAFLAQQIARVYEKRSSARVYPGDLATGQPYLHLDDLLDAIARIVDCRGTLPPEWHVLIGETDVMTYGEIQKSLGRLIHDQEWKTQSVPKSVARAGAWAVGVAPPDPVKNEVFAILQRLNRLNLLVPEDAPHMYHAAMESKTVRLTALGEHYRRLVADGLI